MSVRTWLGGASAVAQVWKSTVTDTVSTHTYILTLTDEAGGTASVTYTNGGSESVSTITTGLAALVNGSADPRFSTVTATTSTGTLILTAKTAGTPFRPATSGTGTWTVTGNTTANSGPYDWATPSNWAAGTVPVASDSVNLSGSNAIKYGLDQSAISLGAVQRVGGASMALGSAGKYLKLACTSFTDNGQGQAYIDFGSSSLGVTINNGSGSVSSPGLYLKGSSIGTLTCAGGNTAVAAFAGETATVTTILMESGASCQTTSGVTLTNWSQAGGTGILGCAATTVIISGGTFTTEGSGAITTLTVAGSGTTCYPKSSGTITTLNCNGGTTDFRESDTARTITTPNIGAGASLYLDYAYLTLTNGLVGSKRLSITTAQV